jgi:hypothetical protein
MSPPNPDNPERRIHELLRTLPGRTAPRTLESRVLAELQRLESRPRWRRSYLSWPLSLRGAFLAVSAAAVAVLAAGPARVFGALARHFEWLAALQSIGGSLIGSAQDVFHAIPAPWLHGALAAVAVCYAALAGVGALAYRIFFRSKPPFSRRLPA